MSGKDNALACHDVVAAQPGKILRDYHVDHTAFHIFKKLFESGTFKVKSRIAIINIDFVDGDIVLVADLSHIVVNTLVNDLIEMSRSNFADLKSELDSCGIASAVDFFVQYGAEDMKSKRECVINLSDRIDPENFKGIIRGSIHHSQNVERMNEKGKYIIRKLFEAYYAHPQQLPDGPVLHFLVETGNIEASKNVEEAIQHGVGAARIRFEAVMDNPKIYEQCVLMRRICDHIASMTVDDRPLCN